MWASPPRLLGQQLVLLLALVTCSFGTLSNGALHEQDAPIRPTKPNLVDLLTWSPDHVILVRLLQRTRLIPTLMNLMEYGDGRGLTILAPTDDAIRKKIETDRVARSMGSMLTAEYFDDERSAQSIWEWAMYLAEQEEDEAAEDLIVPFWQDDKLQLGNVNAVLRQQLLYHMVNYTIPYNLTSEGRLQTLSSTTDAPATKVDLLSTLHRPSRRLLHEPTRPGPIPHPPSAPPHPGAEDNGGLLAGEGQKMRIATRDNTGEVWIGTDSKGSGGVKITKADDSSSSGLLLSIDGIVDVPPSLEKLLKDHPSLQHLRNLTTTTLLASLTEAAHSTFFLPTEKSFENLTSIEKTFITGDWELAKQDRLKLLAEHMSGTGLGQRGYVAYAQKLKDEQKSTLTTIFGGQIHVEADDKGRLTVSGAKVVEEDVLIENGVVHIVDALLLPFGDLNLSVEKTLLALNASRFVSLMHTAGLESYINASPHDSDDPDHIAEPWTFMVPRDDVVDEWWREQEREAVYQSGKWAVSRESIGPPRNSAISKPDLVDLLRYHIAPDQLTPENLTNGMLVGTELRDWKLKDARQKIVVGVQSTPSMSKPQDNGDVGFGDANVIATPLKVGPSIIYLISQMLEPPSNALQTAVSSLSLSTFVATVFSAELDKSIKRAPAITYLVPHNDAFASLGLAMQYLLLDQVRSRNELRSVVEYHAIDEIVYMQDFPSGSKRYPTLEESPIWAGKNENGTVEIKRGTAGRNARVLKGDFLTSTGVLHEIDQVELPPTLDLTIEKLMKGAKADTMKDLVQQAGYGWILNASQPDLAAFDEESDASSGTRGKFPSGHKKEKKRKKQHKKRHQLLGNENQAYVILCPTDTAFTKINLTYYYSEPEALKALVQLHIIPSPADQVLPDGNAHQLPLSIKDASSFTTLLDAAVGGMSSFGKLAFRKNKGKKGSESALKPEDPDEPGLGWVVGVADTRGTDGKLYSANVLSFGRESLALKREEQGDKSTMKKGSKDGGGSNKGDKEVGNSRAVGGILTIDNVLQPYKPNWFYRWGWIALSSLVCALVLAGIGYGVWTWYRKDGRIKLPEALEGEEE